ncbi:putative dehydrogenase [Bacillus sp. TS-2]|nr:putative dehydrogenase [Bacillus sp. TS-2]
MISRSRPKALDLNDGVDRIWLEVDLSRQNKLGLVKEALQNKTIDVLIYNVGVWEKDGFEEYYDFDNDDPKDIATILNINLTSTITFIQALLPNIRRSKSGKIILIGSTAGLDHTNHSQVAFVTSKHGLRGIANAVREHVRKDKIAVTCMNPGELAAEIPYEEGADKAISEYGGTRIPVQDMVALVNCIVSLSPVSCVKEINIPAITDLNC